MEQSSDKHQLDKRVVGGGGGGEVPRDESFHPPHKGKSRNDVTGGEGKRSGLCGVSFQGVLEPTEPKCATQWWCEGVGEGARNP